MPRKAPPSVGPTAALKPPHRVSYLKWRCAHKASSTRTPKPDPARLGSRHAVELQAI